MTPPVVAAVDWTYIIVALIAGLPAIISAVGVILVHEKIRTPSGKSIGKQVEDTQHTVISNNQYAAAISQKVGADESHTEQPAEA